MAISTGRTVEGGEIVHHQAHAAKPKKGSKNLQPSMTPMIDVTFQLILFFILTFEFRESEGVIPGTLARGGPPPSAVWPLAEPIRIRLIPSADRQSAHYELTGVAAAINSPSELGRLLQMRQEQLGSSQVPVVIHPDGQAPWGFVVEAYNQARKAKFEKIGFDRETM